MSAAGYGAMAGAVVSAVGALATDYDSQYAHLGNPAETAANIESMDFLTSEYMNQYNIFTMQREELNRSIGDKMTQRGLKAVQAEGYIRAAAAVSGTSGGTTTAASYQAYVDQELDNGIILSEGTQSQIDLARRAIFDKISYESKMKATISGTQVITSGGASMFASALSGAASGFQSGLGMMSNTQIDKMFQSSTKTTPIDNGTLYEGGASGWN